MKILIKEFLIFWAFFYNQGNLHVFRLPYNVYCPVAKSVRTPSYTMGGGGGGREWISFNFIFQIMNIMCLSPSNNVHVQLAGHGLIKWEESAKCRNFELKFRCAILCFSADRHHSLSEICITTRYMYICVAFDIENPIQGFWVFHIHKLQKITECFNKLQTWMPGSKNVMFVSIHLEVTGPIVLE